jgi:hypothetical protein
MALALFALVCFSDTVCVFAYPTSDHDPPSSTSIVVGIAGMSHQAWPLPKSFEKLLIYPIFIHQDTGM